MSRSLMGHAFAHHVWATNQLLDACLPLTSEQLDTAVPGTYGSILETLRHLVVGDAGYLFDITGERTLGTDEDPSDLPGLRAAVEATGAAWWRLLGEDLDPDAVVHEVDPDDGYERYAPVGIRLAQALHHGSDHRSQICTALTMLGLTPPAIDVWDYGVQTGRIVEVLPKT